MLRVFLVEDEVVIRKGIVKTVDWQAEGFELVGDAGDGELAYPMIQDTRPDIVITDIRMPFMDGLELSRLIKKELPKTRIIILSGYNEFDYAKQAIDIGVEEYLVKPIDGENLLSALKKVGASIAEERRKMDLMAAYSRRVSAQEAYLAQTAETTMFQDGLSYPQAGGSAQPQDTSSMESHNAQTEATSLEVDARTSSKDDMQYSYGERESSRRQSTTDDTPIDMKELKLSTLNSKSIMDFLNTGKRDQIDNFLTSYFEDLGPSNLKSTLFTQYVLYNMYFAFAEYLKKLGVSDEENERICGTPETIIQRLYNLESGRVYIQSIMEGIIDIRDAKKNRVSSLMLEATNYIQQHFQEDDFSLNQTAAAVNLSPNHFSTVFRKEMGQTFIEYLTDVRMNEAKHLVATTKERVTDISYMVGYRDPHYFSSLFKKTQGMTPKEYRNSMEAGSGQTQSGQEFSQKDSQTQSSQKLSQNNSKKQAGQELVQNNSQTQSGQELSQKNSQKNADQEFGQKNSQKQSDNCISPAFTYDLTQTGENPA